MTRTLPLPAVPRMANRSESRRIADRLEDQLSAVLAADLLLCGGLRLHIALFSELPRYDVHPDVGGLFAEELYHIVGGQLDPRRMERGDGPLIVLADHPGGELAEPTLTGRAVHECGHSLTAPTMFRRPEDRPADAPRGLPLSATLALPPGEWPVYAGKGLQETHRHDFLRALLHVRHRLEERGGESVPLTFFGNWRAYSYRSPIEAYAYALAGELSQSRGPIRGILAIPPPRQFRELWLKDTGEQV